MHQRPVHFHIDFAGDHNRVIDRRRAVVARLNAEVEKKSPGREGRGFCPLRSTGGGGMRSGHRINTPPREWFRVE